MASAAVRVREVLKVQCNNCSRFSMPSEILDIGTGGAKICWRCYEWHLAALKALAGKPPVGCQECGVTFAALRERHGDNVPMRIHGKDGIYQVLCRACSDSYERKRLDLYGSTLYGWRKKLKGAK